jgi:predicted esterase
MCAFTSLRHIGQRLHEGTSKRVSSTTIRLWVGLPIIIIGGFSGGAIMSLEITMANVLPVKGFVGLCLELKPLSILHQ